MTIAAATAPEVDVPNSGTDDKPLVHAVCRGCFPTPGPDDIGMCGERPRMPAINPVPPADRPLCVICEELYPKPCEKCGAV